MLLKQKNVLLEFNDKDEEEEKSASRLIFFLIIVVCEIFAKFFASTQIFCNFGALKRA